MKSSVIVIFLVTLFKSGGCFTQRKQIFEEFTDNVTPLQVDSFTLIDADPQQVFSCSGEHKVYPFDQVSAGRFMRTSFSKNYTDLQPHSSIKISGYILQNGNWNPYDRVYISLNDAVIFETTRFDHQAIKLNFGNHEIYELCPGAITSSANFSVPEYFSVHVNHTGKSWAHLKIQSVVMSQDRLNDRNFMIQDLRIDVNLCHQSCLSCTPFQQEKTTFQCLDCQTTQTSSSSIIIFQTCEDTPTTSYYDLMGKRNAACAENFVPKGIYCVPDPTKPAVSDCLVAADATDCLTCQPGYVSADGICQKECRSSQYQLNGVCVPYIIGQYSPTLPNFFAWVPNRFNILNNMLNSSIVDIKSYLEPVSYYQSKQDPPEDGDEVVIYNLPIQKGSFTRCFGKEILGGFGVLGRSSTILKHQTIAANFAANFHSYVVQLHFILLLIDNWQFRDYLEIQIKNSLGNFVLLQKLVFDSESDPEGVHMCGMTKFKDKRIERFFTLGYVKQTFNFDTNPVATNFTTDGIHEIQLDAVLFDNFYMKSFGIQKAVFVREDCSAFCAYCESSAKCLLCVDGQSLDKSTFNCLQNCHATCSTCDGHFNCTLCLDTNHFQLKSGICAAACPPEFYEKTRTENPQKYCENCGYGCQQCTDSTTCTTCLPGKYQRGNQCTDDCPEQLWYIVTGPPLLCQPCHISCGTCSGPLEADCIACNEAGGYQYSAVFSKCIGVCDTTSINKYWDGGKKVCTGVCPFSTYTIPSDGVCAPCHSANCMQCTNSTNIGCTYCYPEASQYTAQPHYLTHGVCETACPPLGYYTRMLGGAVAPSFRCDQCVDANCNSCDITLACVQCKTTPTSYKLKLGACVENCGELYFEQSGICYQCAPNCLSCTGPNLGQCLSCIPDTYLFQGSCLQECPVSTFLNSGVCENCIADCLTCVNNSVCVKCNSNEDFYKHTDGICRKNCPYYYVENVPAGTCDFCTDQFYIGTCLIECPPLTFEHTEAVTNNKSCRQCDSSCATCSGEGPENCITCATGNFLNNSICLKRCPDGSYGNELLQTCVPCPDNCQVCTAAGCLMCAANYFIIDDASCALDCPAGNFKNQVFRKCVQCHESCSTCMGSLPDQCVECPSTLIFEYGRCVIACTTFNILIVDPLPKQCLSCHENCNTCTGITANDCQTCHVDNYLLTTGSDNTCIADCPATYFNDSLFGVCGLCHSSCQTCSGYLDTECLTCETPTYLLFGICVANCPGNQFPKEDERRCVPCHSTCRTCNGQLDNNCVLCQHERFWDNGFCLTECPPGQEPNLKTGICQAGITDVCHATCAKCTGPDANNCVRCVDGLFLDKSTSTCNAICPSQQYGRALSKTCEPCFVGCSECETQYDNCTACVGNRVTLPSCPCPSGYISNDINPTCSQCNIKCQSCSDVSSNCVACAGNREQNPPICSCSLGFYDIGEANCSPCNIKCQYCYGSPTACTKCRGDRTDVPNCTCPLGSFEDNSSVFCPRCASNCESCTSSASNCLTCSGIRVSPPSCQCPSGFWDNPTASEASCTECDFNCKTCQSPGTVCLSCKGDRTLVGGKCVCGDGTYDDNSSEFCLQCPLECQTCSDALSCLSCAGNRIGPDSLSQCTCAEKTFGRLLAGSPFCATCRLGVPLIQVSDTQDSIVIDFGEPVELVSAFKRFSSSANPSFDMCTFFLTTEAIAVIGGSSAKCSLTDGGLVYINLGDNPTFAQGDELKLRTDIYFFKFLHCIVAFTEYKNLEIKPPNNVVGSIAEFEYPKGITFSLCEDVTIKVTKLIGGGKGPFSTVSWDVLVMNPDDSGIQTTLGNLLVQPTTEKAKQITIPAQTLGANTDTTFSYQFVNDQNIEGTTPLLIKSSSTQGAFVELAALASGGYFPQQQVNLELTVLHKDCSGASTTLVNDRMQVDFVQLTGSLIPGLTTTIYREANTGNTLTHQLLPFSFKAGEQIQFKIIAKLLEQPSPVQYTIAGEFMTKFDTFTAQILEGNQNLFFNDQVKLTSYQRNLNIKPADDIASAYNLQWECVNINTDGPCISYENEVINFDNFKTNTLQLAAQTLVPYNGYAIKFKAQYSDQTASAGATVFITQAGLPKMEYTLPAYLQERPINLKESIGIQLQYEAEADELFFAAALIYNNLPVASFQFNYLDFQFRMIDKFDRFGENPKIFIKISIYDPKFILPTQVLQELEVNVPPLNCRFELTDPTSQGKTQIVLSTEYSFDILGCEDSEKPLSYRYGFFSNRDEFYQDIMTGQTLGINYISEFSSTSSLKFILPIPKKPVDATLLETIRFDNWDEYHDPSAPSQNLPADVSELILIAFAADAKGGLRNITKRVAVQLPKTINVKSILDNLKQWSTSGANEVYQLNIYSASVCQYDSKSLDGGSSPADYKILVDYMNQRVDELKKTFQINMQLFSILSKTESILTTCEEVDLEPIGQDVLTGRAGAIGLQIESILTQYDEVVEKSKRGEAGAARDLELIMNSISFATMRVANLLEKSNGMTERLYKNIDLATQLSSSGNQTELYKHLNVSQLYQDPLTSQFVPWPQDFNQTLYWSEEGQPRLKETPENQQRRTTQAETNSTTTTTTTTPKSSTDGETQQEEQTGEFDPLNEQVGQSTEEEAQVNKNLLQSLRGIVQKIVSNMVPNQDAYEQNVTNLKIEANQLTHQALLQLLQPDRYAFDAENEIDTPKGVQDANKKNAGKTYSYENLLFHQNPYVPDLKFISKNSSFALFDIEINENLPNGGRRLLRNLQEVTNDKFNSKVTYSFGAPELTGPESSQFVNCVTQNETDNWERGKCIQKNHTNSDQLIICQCSEIRPTTAVFDYQNFFFVTYVTKDNKLLQTINQKDASVVFDFQYTQSYTFWLFIIFTVWYVLSIVFGFKADSKQKRQVVPSHSQDSQKQITQNAQAYRSQDTPPQSSSSAQKEEQKEENNEKVYQIINLDGNVQASEETPSNQDQLPELFSSQRSIMASMNHPELKEKENNFIQEYIEQNAEYLVKEDETQQGLIDNSNIVINQDSIKRIFQNEHCYISIYTTYFKQLSRNVRFSLQYWKLVLILAGILTYDEFLDQSTAMTFAGSILITIIIKIIVNILYNMIKIMRGKLLILVYTIQTIVLIISIYGILVLSSFSTKQDDEFYLFAFLLQFFLDFFLYESLIIIIKLVSIVQCSIVPIKDTMVNQVLFIFFSAETKQRLQELD